MNEYLRVLVKLIEAQRGEKRHDDTTTFSQILDVVRRAGI